MENNAFLNVEMECQNNFSPIVPTKLSCIFVSVSIHELLNISTELLSVFLADLPTWGGNLDQKYTPGVDILYHDFL